MPNFGIFRLGFENNIVIFEISTVQFGYLQSLAEKQKCLNLGPKCLIWVFLTKNALFGYFWDRSFKKLILIFEISTLKFAK